MAIHDNHATFTLKLTGIDLDDIHAGDVGKLLSEFSRLLDDDSLKFGEICQGSAVVTAYAPTVQYEKILCNFNQNICRSIDKKLKNIIRNYATAFQDIQAQFLASPTRDIESRVICEIDYREQTELITQMETVIGKLQKLAHGRDNTDHFTILLHNGKTISVKVNKILSQDLADHLKTLWLGESLIEFTGTAKYEINGFESNLRSFTAKSFAIIPDSNNIDEWASQFISFGHSGWQQLDNPLETWIKERH